MERPQDVSMASAEVAKAILEHETLLQKEIILDEDFISSSMQEDEIIPQTPDVIHDEGAMAHEFSDDDFCANEVNVDADMYEGSDETEASRESAINEIATLESQLVQALEALKALKDKPRLTFRGAIDFASTVLKDDREAELLLDEVGSLRTQITDLTARATLFLMGSNIAPSAKDEGDALKIAEKLFDKTGTEVNDEENADVNFSEIVDETTSLLLASRDIKIRLLELRKTYKDRADLKDAIETIIVSLLNDDKSLMEHIEQKDYFLSIHNTVKTLKEEEQAGQL